MNNQGYLGNFLPSVPILIANGQAESVAIALGGLCLVGIIFPAAFTGTTVTFEVCDTVGGTYVPLKSTTSGTSLSYTIAQGTYQAIDPKDFQGVQFLKIKSGSNEGADRTILCSLKGL